MIRKALSVATAVITAFTCAIGLTACNQDAQPNPDPGDEHTHVYSSEWTSDETSHWHICTEANCDAVSDKTAHEWDSGVVETPSGCGTTGTVKYTCNVCGYQKTETTPAGTHTFDTEWSSDATNHWHEATCGHDLVAEQGKHEWNEQNVCAVCWYKMQYTEGLEYEKSGQGDNAELSVKSIGSATDTELVIPAYAEADGETLPVTMVGKNAFLKNQSITSVVIPDGVTIIYDRAFNQCKNLVKIVFPDTLKEIKREAFAYCEALQNFELPRSLLSLRTWSFMNCNSLTSVTIPSKVQYVTSAFANCSSLKTVAFPESDTIGSPDISAAFEGCSALQSVTLPEGMTIINDSAFRRCESLTSIDLPDALTTIESDAFAYCSRLITITLPAGVTTIEDGAFDACSILEVFNKSALKIVAGESTFGGIAANAVNVYTPSSGSSVMTTTADGFVFIKASSGWTMTGYIGEQQQITLPSYFLSNDGETVTSYTVRSDAFDQCKDLTAINVLQDNTNYSSQNGVLYDKRGSTLVRVPMGMEGDYVMPDDCRYLESTAFYNCEKLTSVTFGNSLTELSDAECLTGCYGLETITIGSGVTEINLGIFDNAENLSEIIVADGNKNYASVDGLLYDKEVTELLYLPWEKGGELVIPDGVTSLGNLGLRENNRITSVSLPSSLTYLGYGFYYCTGLEKIEFRGTVEQWKTVKKTYVDGNPTWAEGLWYVSEVVCSNGSVEIPHA